MSLVDELQKLNDLHLSGALSDEEFAAAKIALLSQSKAQDNPAQSQNIQEQLDQLQLQNRLAQLDRHWELQCERYFAADKHGHRHPPAKASGLIACGLLSAFGLAASITGFAENKPAVIVLGLACVAGGIVLGLFTQSKAIAYERAYKRYRRHRAELCESNPSHP